MTVNNNFFIYPWRTEMRVSQFHPYRLVELHRTLAEACARAKQLKSGKHSCVRVRAN